MGQRGTRLRAEEVREQCKREEDVWQSVHTSSSDTNIAISSSGRLGRSVEVQYFLGGVDAYFFAMWQLWTYGVSFNKFGGLIS